MKPTRIFFVIFLCSLLTLVPLLSSSQSIKLFPFERQNVIINIQSPNLDVSSNIVTEVELSIYYLDPILDEIVSITNVSIFGEISLELEKRGNYLFQLFSIGLGEIEIDQNGLYLSSPILVILIGLVNMGYRFYLRYRNIIEY